MAETMEIPLTRGQVAIVDAEDFEWLSQYKWFADWDQRKKGYYAVTKIHIGNGKYKNTSMHRLIMDAKKGEIVDHINGHGLNNTRENLRIVTARENAINQKLCINNTSGKMGVTFDKECNKWRVRIHIEGKRITIGRFDNFQDAVAAREMAEREHYGEFVRKTEPIEEKYVHPAQRDTAPVLWYLLGYGEVYTIPLTKGYCSIVDVEDYEKVAKYVWWFSEPGYAKGYVDGNEVWLHRFIMNPAEGLIVDHINGDKSDDRRCNLRCITQQQNTWNNHAKIGNRPHKNIRKVNYHFEVSMQIDGVLTWCGSFPTIEEALVARNAAYREHRGEFARYED